MKTVTQNAIEQEREAMRAREAAPEGLEVPSSHFYHTGDAKTYSSTTATAQPRQASSPGHDQGERRGSEHRTNVPADMHLKTFYVEEKVHLLEYLIQTC